MAIDVISNTFHGVDRSNEHYKQIDDQKKIRSEKVQSDFNKALKTEKAKAMSPESSLRAASWERGNLARPGVTPVVTPEIASSLSAPRNDGAGLTAPGNDLDKNGTDLALKKVAADFEKQVLGVMWNIAFSTVDREFQGGLGEELFHKELVNEMVKLSNTGEMGDIAESIYRDLKAKDVAR